MKTSVVIAATNGNFGYLDCILAHYRDGTIRPNQLVISVSNAHLIDAQRISSLRGKYSSIFEDLKIIEHNKIMVQGPNRDVATMAADNEIIISNDADDIPHPQRVEVIKHFFDNYDIMHLNHSYKTREDRDFDHIDINSVKVFDPHQTYTHLFPNYNGEPYTGRRPKPNDYGFNRNCYGAYGPWEWIHAGCPTFHKDVFKELRWRQTEEFAWDWDFDIDVLFHFRKSILIDSKLMWYNLSVNRRDNPTVEDLGILYKE